MTVLANQRLTQLLALGARGNEVAALQEAINALRLGPPLKPDGRFGLRTHAAVVAFQRR